MAAQHLSPDALQQAFAAWFKALYIERGFVSSEKELNEAFHAGAALAKSLLPAPPSSDARAVAEKCAELVDPPHLQPHEGVSREEQIIFPERRRLAAAIRAYAAALPAVQNDRSTNAAGQLVLSTGPSEPCAAKAVGPAEDPAGIDRGQAAPAALSEKQQLLAAIPLGEVRGQSEPGITRNASETAQPPAREAGRRFPICKDHVSADWNEPTLDDDACVLCRLFYLEAQEGLLEEWQQRAKRAEDAIAEVKRPLNEQMARLNATVTKLNEENDRLERRLEAAETWVTPDTEADGVVFCGRCGAKR